MFAVDCDGHGGITLLGIDAIEALADGELHWRCWCGHHGRSKVTELVQPVSHRHSVPSAA